MGTALIADNVKFVGETYVFPQKAIVRFIINFMSLNIKYYIYFSSFDEEVTKIFKKMAEKDETWIVKIVRTNFVFTAMEELKMTNDYDWSSPFRVKFLGEEGIDLGGPRREFFSLRLSNSTEKFVGVRRGRPCICFRQNLWECSSVLKSAGVVVDHN